MPAPVITTTFLDLDNDLAMSCSEGDSGVTWTVGIVLNERDWRQRKRGGSWGVRSVAMPQGKSWHQSLGSQKSLFSSRHSGRVSPVGRQLRTKCVRVEVTLRSARKYAAGTGSGGDMKSSQRRDSQRQTNS